MRKKSKKRIPQDIKAWVRSGDSSNNSQFWVSGRKTTRWISGSRRDWETRLLSSRKQLEQSNIIFKSLSRGVSNLPPVDNAVFKKIDEKIRTVSKLGAYSKHKNYCAISGRGRTFNRSLYMARHIIRKFVGVGAISGLIK